MTAAVVARAFLLISRFIPPTDVTSDRGPQFVLELWSAMADSLGVKVHQTTAYHPQTNGMCEQLHESLKAALWGSLTGLRCAVREDLWDSPAELVLGQPLRDPGEFMPASPPASYFNTSMLSLRPTRDSFSIPGAPLPARPYCSVWRPVQGYSTRPKAFPFWTLEVGRRLFLLIDLSLHMSCWWSSGAGPGPLPQLSAYHRADRLWFFL